MDLSRKFEIASRAIASIAEHDDAPQTDVEECLTAVSHMIKTHGEQMIRRRELKAAARESVTITAGDVGTVPAALLN